MHVKNEEKKREFPGSTKRDGDRIRSLNQMRNRNWFPGGNCIYIFNEVAELKSERLEEDELSKKLELLKVHY